MGTISNLYVSESSKKFFIPSLSSPVTYRFAIITIFAVGCLLTAIGLSALGGRLGWWNAYALNHIGQVKGGILLSLGLGSCLLSIALGAFSEKFKGKMEQKKIEVPVPPNLTEVQKEEPKCLIYGKEVWENQGFKIVENIPDVGEREKIFGQIDPFFKASYKENFILFYIPQAILVNGKKVNVCFSELKSCHKMFEDLLSETQEEKIGKNPLKSGWRLLSRGLIPNSKACDFEEQKQLVAKEGFRMPFALEATLLNLFVSYREEITLFPENIYCRCLEEIGDKTSITVGDFTEGGLSVWSFDKGKKPTCGVIAVKEV